MIMFTLAWWNYLVIGATVFASAYAVTLVESWREVRKPNPSYPCLADLGMDSLGTNYYCGMLDGHTGSHGALMIVAAPDTSDDDPFEWPVTSAPFGGDDQQ